MKIEPLPKLGPPTSPILASEMTLRDHFAGQAMVGLFMTRVVEINRPLEQMCYDMADRMLAQREVTPP
jgi:hypothetical protein